MYAAIDVLADKLDRCVKKHKEKKCDHHASEAAALRAQYCFSLEPPAGAVFLTAPASAVTGV